jgi:hypothetical protein
VATIPPVQFRLKEAEYKELEKAAEARGMRVSAWARDQVRAALFDSRHDELRAELGALLTQVAGLRKDVANGVLMLLVNAGKMTKAEANRWAHEYLNR